MSLFECSDCKYQAEKYLAFYSEHESFAPFCPRCFGHWLQQNVPLMKEIKEEKHD